MPWAAPLHHALLCLKAPSGAEEPGGGAHSSFKGRFYMRLFSGGGALSLVACVPLVWEWSGTQQALLAGCLRTLVESTLTSGHHARYSYLPNNRLLSGKLCLI